MMFVATSWVDAIASDPVESAMWFVALLGITAVSGVVLQRISRHTRSLRLLVLAITLTSLVIAAVAALLLARLMVLDSEQARSVLQVLAVTAVLATGLAVVASAQLGRDAERLEETVRRIEAGDRSARTDVQRADELGHVAHALDQLSERLDLLERERASFEDERRSMLTSIGHDLRTPLAALRAAIEALQDGVAPDVPRYLRAMAHDVEALSSLVDDLFLLSRIEAGRLDLVRARVDLRELADEAVEAITPAAAARDISIALRCNEDVRVDANARALGRVIRNLLDNAVRHAPAGSPVVVSIARTGVVTVRVTDEGPGFDAEFAPLAFDRFSRADQSRNRSSGGAGLGLAIARGLIEAHGGRIWIEPPPGGTVAFELPPAMSVRTPSHA
jgi:two-component system sensor histidine kinase BaeS